MKYLQPRYVIFMLFGLAFLSANLAQAEVTLTFDDGYPESRRATIQSFHDKIIPLLNQVTGQSPELNFVLMYTPETHLGFNDAGTILYDQNLPGGVDQYGRTFNWFWWYMIEITHFYIPRLSIWQNNPDLYNLYAPYFNPNMSTREREYMSHAVVQYIIATYSDQFDEFVDSDLFYQNITRAWTDPLRDQSIRSIKPQTAFQVDTNYNNFNSVACDFVGSLFFKFALIDSDFFARLFSTMSEAPIINLNDYFNAVSSSIDSETIDGIEKDTWLQNHPYFARYKEENLTTYSLDIITFTKQRADSYSRHNISPKDPQSFIVTGSSIANYQAGSGSVTNVDEDFFGQVVNYSIKNQAGRVVASGDTHITENMWSSRVYLPQLDPGTYSIETSFIAANGEPLADTEIIYITGGKSLYTEDSHLLTLNNISYLGGLYDITGAFDSRTGSFTLSQVCLEQEETNTNGNITDFENIYVENVLVGGQFVHGKLRFDGRGIYVSEVY